MFVPANSNVGVWAQIGVLSNSSAYASWLGRAGVMDDGATEGFGGTVAIPAAWRGQTVEIFLSFLHRSAAATGDIVVRADIGPRQEPEAAGAPNDAASLRVDTTIVGVATVAGDKQDELRYVSIGTFAIDALDRNLIYNIARLGADASDTFGASVYAFGAHILVP